MPALYLTSLAMWLFVVLTSGEVYLLIRRDNFKDVVASLYLSLSEIYTYVKLVVFWRNKHKVLALLNFLHCEEFKPKEEEHRGILRKSIQKARFIMIGYATMCVGAVSVGIIMPVTENFTVLPTNVEYPWFDAYRPPLYQIIYIHHIYYKPATCIIDAAMDTILASFITCAIGQIEILSFNLERVYEVAERRRSREVAVAGRARTSEHYVRAILRDCIIHHNTIIRYVSMLEDAFSLASALQFMLSAMVLCLVGLQLLMIENPASHPMQILWMAIYLYCMLTEVFILCWFGNELIWKSRQLQQAAYNSDWVTMSQSCTIYLKILRERCQRPLKVTAGKIFTLSLETYTILMNWSYKAFALMSNMKK